MDHERVMHLLTGELTVEEKVAAAGQAALVLIKACEGTGFDPRFILNTALALRSRKPEGSHDSE